MTAARQKRKRGGVRRGACWAACAGLLLLWLAQPPARAALTERVVVDRHTGLAISGYDPVAFYTTGKPVAGSAEFELSYAGVVWRFSNPGNREAFAARPDVYMPQFGGYDPTGVARGVAVPGTAQLWLVIGEHLFLFYDQAELDRFAADPARLLAEAERQWPGVLQTLSP